MLSFRRDAIGAIGHWLRFIFINVQLTVSLTVQYRVYWLLAYRRDTLHVLCRHSMVGHLGK